MPDSTPSAAGDARTTVEKEDEPHTGDDALLDEIAAAYTALDMAIDESDDQFGEDAREAVSTAMDALEKAQALRVAELKALASFDRSAGIARREQETEQTTERRRYDEPRNLRGRNGGIP